MAFEDSMYSKSLGFELREDPEEPRRVALKGTAQLFFLFALIFGLLFPAVSLIRGGVLKPHHIRAKNPNLALRAEAKWDSKIVGSLASTDTIFPDKVWPKPPEAKPGAEAPKAPAPEWYGFDGAPALVRPGMADAKKAEEGKTPAEAKDEHAAENEHGGKKASAQANLQEVRGDWVEAEVEGWVPASLVEVSPGGFEGAWSTRSGTLITFWAIAGFCLLVSVAMPAAMVWFYNIWMTVLVGWLGHFNTKVFMTLFFFLILAPAAFVMRLLGKDPLDRTIVKDDPTYWKDKDELDQHHFHRSF